MRDYDTEERLRRLESSVNDRITAVVLGVIVGAVMFFAMWMGWLDGGAQ